MYVLLRPSGSELNMRRIHWSTPVFWGATLIFIYIQIVIGKTQGRDVLSSVLNGVMFGGGLLGFCSYFCYRCVNVRPSRIGQFITPTASSLTLIRRFIGLMFYIFLVALLIQSYINDTSALMDVAWIGMISTALWCAHSDGDLTRHPHRLTVYAGLGLSILASLTLLFMKLTTKSA